MGHRITWRSRPKIWEFFGGAATVDSANPDSSAFTVFAAGPFTLAQVMELMWRVKKLTIEADITSSDGADPPELTTETISVTVERSKSGTTLDAITNESELAAMNLEFGTIAFHDGVGAVAYFEFPLGGQKIDGNNLVGKDENDLWWTLYCGCYAQGANTGIASERDIYGGTIFTTSLVLASGTVPLRMSAYEQLGDEVTAVTASITAVEWFPYATRAGADAWNTATGAAANGGPGA